MSKQDFSVNEIKRRDFGISLKEFSQIRPHNRIKPSFCKNSLISFLFDNNINNRKDKFIYFIRTNFKFLLNFLLRLKRNFTRSIFIGRGLYFKYVSNFALLFIVSFGAFVYIGYDRSSASFISKYSGVSALNSGILFNPGVQAFVTQKEYRVIQYTVQPGDTLSSIAAKYSSQDNVITVDTILWANNLTTSSVLTPGMKLDILPVAGVLHTVKKGDTILSIAKQYGLLSDESPPEKITGVTQQITDINYLNVKVVQSGSDELRVPELIEGQRLIIPGGVIKVVPPPVVPVATIVKSSPPPPVANNNVDIGPRGVLSWPVEGGAGYISQGWKPWHRAVDIAYKGGSNLVAMDSGVIINIGYGFYGTSCGIGVQIAYSSGYTSIYCHLNAIAPGLSKGSSVQKGQVVGNMGCTGVCTGPHVHLEIFRNGVRINPCQLDIFKGRPGCV